MAAGENIKISRFRGGGGKEKGGKKKIVLKTGLKVLGYKL